MKTKKTFAVIFNPWACLSGAALAMMLGASAHSDIYHYRSVLIGDRAAGLGGAYTAISDDASGVYYNPAGIAFAEERYLSVAANAYTVNEVRYAEVFAGKDYIYRSENLAPNYFGFTQSLGDSTKFGFAVVVPSSENIDQEDSFDSVSVLGQIPSKWTRRYMKTDSTYMFGPAFAFELQDNLTVGVSLLGLVRNEKLVDNQTRVGLANINDFYIRMDSFRRTTYGIQPKFGIQYMPYENWAFGITVSKLVNLSGTGTWKRSVRCTDNINCSAGVIGYEVNVPYQLPSPINLAAGVAHFLDKSFLISADFEFHTGQDIGQDGFSEYQVQPTFNWSAGAEYFLSESLAVRAGAFSNLSNTPALRWDRYSQPDHVDMYGGSLSFAVVKKGASIAIGSTFSQGTGDGQVLTTDSQYYGSFYGPIQSVTNRSLSFFVMASQQL